MVFHETDKPKAENKRFSFSVEKRRLDNKFAILIEPQDHLEIDVYEVKECNLLTGFFEKPYLELQIDVRENENVQSDTLHVAYTPVEDFTFYPFLLYPKSLESYPDYFLLLKK